MADIIVGLVVIRRVLFRSIPNFVKARTNAQRNACIANLKQIDGAKATWALEQKKTNTDTPAVTELYGPANYIRDQPYCPANGTYTMQDVQTKPTCSFGATLGHTL